MNLPQPDTITRREFNQLRLTVAILLATIILLLTIWNLYSISTISRYEKIFEDMLGSRSKLPQLTQMIISYGRFSLPPMALLTLTSLLLITLQFIRLRSSLPIIFTGVFILLLVIHGSVIAFAMRVPLIQIIQGINNL